MSICINTFVIGRRMGLKMAISDLRDVQTH